ELGQQWNALEQKLNQQKVPPVGVAAAKEALFARTVEHWKENSSTTEQNHHLTRRQTLYVQRPKVGATQQTPARFDVQQIASNAERLSAGFERVPAEFQQKLNVGQGAPDSVRGFNQLPKPQFLTAETNMMHKDGFMDKAQVRFKREGNRLPCPADSAVKNSDGEATYHANHVKMPMSQFIAAQGPRENAGLFWNMVDQQDSEVVVDLTNASDPSTAKRSFDYTPPPGETKVYPNGAKVTNNGETRVMGGLFTVQQLEVNGKPRIRIQHNQFNDRTSGSPAELASLATLVRTISPNLAKPVTVHCTAGVGRTSTFIAIQDQVDHLANTGHAHDIQDAAATLRNARGGSAIQTAEQWQTINQVHDNPDAIIGPFLSLAGPAAAG
ncbi:MAG: protein-tyrosine phosphatase family protein, partial [Endozoicomonadaceae bacterium]|nr:protein-tyrosine phosphatase family protein [Endozoicomonadaceae bacterium]